MILSDKFLKDNDRNISTFELITEKKFDKHYANFKLKIEGKSDDCEYFIVNTGNSKKIPVEIYDYFDLENLYGCIEEEIKKSGPVVHDNLNLCAKEIRLVVTDPNSYHESDVITGEINAELQSDMKILLAAYNLFLSKVNKFSLKHGYSVGQLSRDQELEKFNQFFTNQLCLSKKENVYNSEELEYLIDSNDK